MSREHKPTMELDRKVETSETARLSVRIAALERRIETLEVAARHTQQEVERLLRLGPGDQFRS